jgi:YfiH family protein
MTDRLAIPDAWIVPAWPAPRRVRAFFTTRCGGFSAGRFGDGDGMNVGLASGDDRAIVLANRARLASFLPAEPAWLRQVHGDTAIDAALAVDGSFPEADAAWTTMPGRVCAVQTADCLPVLLCDRDGTRVAAAHAGWRGLCGGVVEATIAAAGLRPDRTMAWLGPAIGPRRFEVGDDVRDAFLDAAGSTVDQIRAAFEPHAPGKWLADLARLARIRLHAAGVRDVTHSDLCTVSDPERFYSYRRDGITGRMVAVIWIED